MRSAYQKEWLGQLLRFIKTGKKVSVVGSGPAGLAAAVQLTKAGHEVTVYERDDKIGGLLRGGIPDFKLEKNVIDRRMEVMEKDGVVFKTNVEVGKDLSAEAGAQQRRCGFWPVVQLSHVTFRFPGVS